MVDDHIFLALNSGIVPQRRKKPDYPYCQCQFGQQDHTIKFFHDRCGISSDLEVIHDPSDFKDEIIEIDLQRGDFHVPESTLDVP